MFEKGHYEYEVAPNTGAWIETGTLPTVSQSECVAPNTGAWIETLPIPQEPFVAPSHPIRVRGLKPV